MSFPPLLRVHREQNADGVRISLTGEMDLETAPVFTAALSPWLGQGSVPVHVDLSAVTFCDCSGLRALLLAVEAARNGATVLRIQTPGPAVLRLLALTGTRDVLLGPLAPVVSRKTGPGIWQCPSGAQAEPSAPSDAAP